MTYTDEIPAGAYPLTREDAELDAYLEAQELAEATAYILHYGIASYVARLRYEEAEVAAYDACLVAGFAEDPITRSASFDGYEMAGMVSPIRAKCAEAGCRLCQYELRHLGGMCASYPCPDHDPAATPDPYLI